MLTGTSWGRTLVLKTILALVVVAVSVAHVLTGRRTSSPAAVTASRLLAVAAFVLTLVVVGLGVQLSG